MFIKIELIYYINNGFKTIKIKVNILNNMGIKNLKIILTQKCANAINTRKLDCYRGMTFGVDLSIFLYKYLYNNDDHIEGLTRLILRLLKNQITPIFVFDGKPPKEKDDTLLQRKEKRTYVS